jgi:hypothetical protein
MDGDKDSAKELYDAKLLSDEGWQRILGISRQ